MFRVDAAKPFGERRIKACTAMVASLANAGYSRSLTLPELSNVVQCKRKFLRFFPQGFRDETYMDWERGYKWRAHQEWQAVLNRKAYQAKLSQGKFLEI